MCSLTDRYVTDHFLPDKAIDALDEAGARVIYRTLQFLSTSLSLKNKLRPLAMIKTPWLRNSVLKKLLDSVIRKNV